MRKHVVAFFLAVVVAVPLLVLAQASAPVPTPEDPVPYIGAILTAFQARNFALVGVLATIGIVWGLRSAGARIPGAVGTFLASRRGGAILALVGGLATAIAVPVLAGKNLSGAVLVDALAYGLASAGGWTVVRRIFLGESVAAPTPPAAS